MAGNAEQIGEVLVLTPPMRSMVGAAFATHEEWPPSGWELSTEFRIRDGTDRRADGIAMVWLDLDRAGPPEWSGWAGGCMGLWNGDAGGMTGWAIELDTFHNDVEELPGIVDPDYPHVSVILDGDLTQPLAVGGAPMLDESQWQRLVVQSRTGHLEVRIDGASVLDLEDWNPPGDRGYIGFSASTGQLYNRHEVRTVRMTALP